MAQIVLGAGCFWGSEAYYEQLIGVESTEVGYAQGQTDNPTYQQVCTQTTGYAEVVKVIYDEHRISLGAILDHYFRIIDPTSLNRQGNDRGSQYRTGIYYTNPADRIIIEQEITRQQESYSQPIVVEVEKLDRYYPAEQYHQEYLKKNPGGYCHIDLNLASPAEKKDGY